MLSVSALMHAHTHTGMHAHKPTHMLLHGLVLQPPHPSNLRHQPGRAARPRLQPLVTRIAPCIVCLLCDS